MKIKMLPARLTGHFSRGDANQTSSPTVPFHFFSGCSTKLKLLKPEDLFASKRPMENDIPHLTGWFNKEKRDAHKRRGSLIAGTNRRWFTLEQVKIANKEQTELALCYYKRKDEEEKCGWLFVADVVSITQDAATKWITIEHPSRILRIQSPTPAQHRVWFSTLSKCCTNVRKEIVSPERDRRHSLPYFTNAMSPVRRNSAEPIASTPKDQLKFLREITGQEDNRSDKENDAEKETKNFNVDVRKEEPAAPVPFARSVAKLNLADDHEIVDFPDVKQTTSRIHQFIKTPSQSVTNALNEDGFDEVCSFHNDSMDSSDSDAEVNGGVYASLLSTDVLFIDNLAFQY
jgi:hypothetical protein